MQFSFSNAFFSMLLVTAFSGVATAQAQSDDSRLQQSFASENAILDTSIPFALGAREARQELRGAFGWPTFQEGLVEGVYFRFDPDGYARFAPTPRLDADVFEVICRPRTHVCMGRKSILAMTLNARGQLQIELQNVVDGDSFFIADELSELPLPATILQPLDQRMELLLSGGGELIIRRNGTEMERLSLSGFGAVAAFLRWVSAKQDYIVLPRGWPIPNSTGSGESIGLTQASNWQSPLRQERVFGALQPTQVPLGQSADAIQLGARQTMAEPEIYAEMPQETPGDDIEFLLAELVRKVSGPQKDVENAVAHLIDGDEFATKTEAPSALSATTQSTSQSLATRLAYLIDEIGLTPELALMIAQFNVQDQSSADRSREDVIVSILEDLGSEIAAAPEGAETIVDGEFLLLSDYFKSVSQ